MNNTSDIIEQLNIEAEKSFSNYLNPFGFLMTKNERTGYDASILFVKEDRYVKLIFNNHPHDYPGYFNVILGVGKDVFPESDYNSIAIWRFKRYIDENNTAKEYALVFEPQKVKTLISEAISDLDRYGRGFIEGDLSLFNKVKAQK